MWFSTNVLTRENVFFSSLSHAQIYAKVAGGSSLTIRQIYTNIRRLSHPASLNKFNRLFCLYRTDSMSSHTDIHTHLFMKRKSVSQCMITYRGRDVLCFTDERPEAEAVFSCLKNLRGHKTTIKHILCPTTLIFLGIFEDFFIFIPDYKVF